MARLPRSKRKHPPSHSEAMKAKWQDPEYRAKMAARDKRREELRREDPERFSRLGVPNGMRKEEANKLWAVADKQADKIMQTLKAEGVLPPTEAGTATAEPAGRTAAAATAATSLVPDTEDGMAEVVLREAFKLALGPTGTRAKLGALNMVLKFTRLPPMAVLKLAMGDAELSVLDAMV
jgi:hypothetical protein